MSYSPEQVEQANQECRHLSGRGGGILNPDYGGNTECITTEDTDDEINTAGVGKIPMIAWYLIGAGILYYAVKKLKIIK